MNSLDDNIILYKEWYQLNRISENAFKKLQGEKTVARNEMSSEKELKISVAISTYNRPKLLIRLIESILSQLYSNYEIIIVDDASENAAFSEINDYIISKKDERIVLLQNETNSGVGVSKLKAYLRCKGDIIIFSDDDDYYIDDTYFDKLNMTYLSNSKCSMTIAPTLVYYELENEYKIQDWNVNHIISNIEYFNGFGSKFSKPNSMFTMSIRAECARLVKLKELKYFNDTPLYLYNLLAEGVVVPLQQAVGVYYVNGKNMTGNARLDYILGNLEAKDDIYNRAMNLRIIQSPARKWYIYNIGMTASYYLKDNKDVRPEDKEVWKWVKKHFSTAEYYKYLAGVILSRKKNNKPINLKYIQF